MSRPEFCWWGDRRDAIAAFRLMRGLGLQLVQGGPQLPADTEGVAEDLSRGTVFGAAPDFDLSGRAGALHPHSSALPSATEEDDPAI